MHGSDGTNARCWWTTLGAVSLIAVTALALTACTQTSEPGEAAAPAVARDEALATLTAASAAAAPVSTLASSEGAEAGAVDVPEGADAAALESYRATQVVADATAGIADVTGLIDSMPPLTSAPPGAGLPRGSPPRPRPSAS